MPSFQDRVIFNGMTLCRTDVLDTGMLVFEVVPMRKTSSPSARRAQIGGAICGEFRPILRSPIYSRKIVGWEVHGEDDSDHAAHLVRRTAFADGIATCATKPVLHGDNGATLNATTVLAMLHWLGVKPSYSRPRVSDDNAFAESLRTEGANGSYWEPFKPDDDLHSKPKKEISRKRCVPATFY